VTGPIFVTGATGTVGQHVVTALAERAAPTKIAVRDPDAACTGVLDDETAREAGFDPFTETITSVSRAHYYPGGSRIVVEMSADRDDGRLLGAGLVGREGCLHRINAVATTLHTGLTVDDLDVGYAPPFGPVGDPVLTAATVLDGDLN
jgi:NAD(P)-dependent dehydrogenase (short-subunit alcohol dehydrogenase family)